MPSPRLKNEAEEREKEGRLMTEVNRDGDGTRERGKVEELVWVCYFWALSNDPLPSAFWK